MLRACAQQHSLSILNQRKEEEDDDLLLTPPQAELFVRMDYLPLSIEVLAWLFPHASASPPKDILSLFQQDANKCHLQVGTVP